MNTRFIVIKALAALLLLHVPVVSCVRNRGGASKFFTQAISFPNTVCACPNSNNCGNLLAPVAGVCTYLGNSNVGRCCTEQSFPQDLPIIDPNTGGCTPECLAVLYSFWCYLPCTDNTVRNGNTPTLCTSPTTELFNKCNGCTFFGTFADYATFAAALGQPVSVNTNCVNFLETAAPVETGPPRIVNNLSTVTPNPVTFTTATSNTVRAKIAATTPLLNTGRQPPTFLAISWLTPSGRIAKTDSFTSTDFQANNIGDPTDFFWGVNSELDIGYKAEEGTWKIVATKLTNTFGIVSNVDIAQFTVDSFFNNNGITNWGNVFACSDFNSVNQQSSNVDVIGSSVFAPGNGQTVGTFRCCDVSRCTIECTDGNAASPVTLTTVSTNLVRGVPFVIDGCVVTATSWTVYDVTDFRNTIVNFINGGSLTLAAVGDAIIRGATSSRLNFASGAALRANNDNGIVGTATNLRLDTSSVFAQGAQFIANGPQRILMNSDATMTIAGQFNILSTGTTFVIRSSSNIAGSLYIQGDGILDGENNPSTGNGRAFCAATSEIEVQSGRFQADNAASIHCAITVVTPTTTSKVQQAMHKKLHQKALKSTKPKFATTQLTPVGSLPGVVSCGADHTRPVVFNTLAALFVVPPDGVDQCQLPGVQNVATRLTSLTLGPQARIVMRGARDGGNYIQADAINFAPGSTLEVELANTGASGELNIALLRYITNTNAVGGVGCDTNINVIITNPTPTRPHSQFCDRDTSVNPNVFFLRLTVPPGQSITPVSTTSPNFISVNTYTLTLDNTLTNCPSTCFESALFDVKGIDAKFIDYSYTQTSTNPNRITVQFRCRSTQTTQNADAVCSEIVRDAQTRGSALQQRINAIAGLINDPNDDDDDGSNTALYGLFALVAICPLLICAAILFLKNKKRKADNQYAQDTATFGSVQNSAMPINYAYPIKPTSPVHAIPPTFTFGGGPEFDIMGSTPVGAFGSPFGASPATRIMSPPPHYFP